MPQTPLDDARQTQDSLDNREGPARMPFRRVRQVRAVAMILLLLVALVVYVDLPLAVWLHANVTPAVDTAFKRIGRLGNGGIYAVGALLVYAGALLARSRGWGEAPRHGYERLARGALLMLLTLASAGLLTWLLKNLVARARPEVFFKHGFYGLGHVFAGHPFDSFPSSHTLAAFSVAASLGIVLPRWRWPLFIVAVLVAASRLVNLDHYLSDVTAAAVVSVTAACLWARSVMDTNRQWPLRAPWRWGRS